MLSQLSQLVKKQHVSNIHLPLGCINGTHMMERAVLFSLYRFKRKKEKKKERKTGSREITTKEEWVEEKKIVSWVQRINHVGLSLFLSSQEKERKWMQKAVKHKLQIDFLMHFSFVFLDILSQPTMKIVSHNNCCVH